MQRLATAVARHLHQLTGAAMVTYQDDWLVFAPKLNVPAIHRVTEQLGLSFNREKSIVHSTTTLVYLGLHINCQISHVSYGLMPVPSA